MEWDFDIYDPDMPVWHEDQDEHSTNKPSPNPDDWAKDNGGFDTPY